MNMSSLTIPTKSKILGLRGILNSVSHTSFSYAQFNRDFPLETMSEEQGKEVVQAYRDMLEELKDVLKLME